MEYRNSSGGVHFGHSITSNIESSHGVELTGGSTGGVVRPASDDASAALSVRAKGASGILAIGTSTGGPLTLAGSSIALASTHVSFNSTKVAIGDNPSSAGALRLGYDAPIHGRTSTDGNTIQIAKTSTGDLVYLGDAAYGSLIRGSSISLASTHVFLNSTRTVIGGGSTTALSAIQRYAVAVPAATFAMSSGIDGGSTVSTVTVAGLSTGSVLHFTFRNPINALYTVRVHCSTAAELKLILGHNGISTLGTGESTNSGTLLEFVF